jgi:hypothetical protein
MVMPQFCKCVNVQVVEVAMLGVATGKDEDVAKMSTMLVP